MSWDREKERKAGKAMTVGSCIFGLAFSIFWCVAVAWMGAWPMLIFGLLFVGMMGYRLYVLLQMSGKDKAQKQKEADPWERPDERARFDRTEASESGYCPYCGSLVQTEFEFCPKCGRRLK